MTSPAAGRRRFAVLAVALLIGLGLVGSGCGSSKSSSPQAAATSGGATTTTRFAKTKFVLHAGLAFGAFHRWIYKPIRSGALRHPLSHKLTTLKAIAAGAFVYHELRLALAAAQASPTLSKLVSPITALQNKIKGVSSSVKSGDASAAEQQVTQANDSVSLIHGQAASAGQPITEQTPSGP